MRSPSSAESAPVACGFDLPLASLLDWNRQQVAVHDDKDLRSLQGRSPQVLCCSNTRQGCCIQ